MFWRQEIERMYGSVGDLGGVIEVRSCRADLVRSAEDRSRGVVQGADVLSHVLDEELDFSDVVDGLVLFA